MAPLTAHALVPAGTLNVTGLPEAPPVAATVNGASP